MMQFPVKVALLAVSLSLGACGDGAPEARQAPPPPTVTTAKVERRSLAGGLVASGRLLPREEVAVASELSGYRVARVLVEEDASVMQGAVLAVLDDGLLRAQIAQARATLAQQIVAADRARSEASRVAGLDDSGVLSQEAIQQRRLAARSADAAVAVARAQLNDLQVREARLVIRAPTGGRVLERAVRPGDTSAAGTMMFRIARAGLVELFAEVPEAEIGAVRVGDQARVTLASGLELDGKVRLRGARVDDRTGLVVARIALPARSELRPGGFARVRFESEGAPVRLVPEGAIHFDADGASVQQLDGQNHVRRLKVRTGRRAGGMVELVEGPAPGSRVVLTGGAFVLEGDAVRVVKAAR